ncbi:Hin recombinase [Clostridium butyricum]|uniref:Dna-binding domain, resolvase family n=3 Tax=Clostridium butyricum TaxID=1492 RepID=C4IN60_CLOBU|nr:putative centrosomal protein [Clostridium butyricum 5521]EEP52305.1 Dna-binding domain, resolvase family [Clostridium butyricum E4 str. BoNT E BL5262]NFL33365.1 Hin recombinase [Clostridium butyricum]NFS20470.1 Hin recombinase [Clostridium butyricum]PPV11990.1 Hin recombinase [Clostridium butyricum]
MNMSKETQKAKIERLEKELKQAQEIIKTQNSEINEMIDKADNSFENSSTYIQMHRRIEDLELKVKVITDSVEHNKRMYVSELKKNSELIKEIYQLRDIKVVQKLNMNNDKDMQKELEKLNKENEELKGKLNAGRKEKFTKQQQEEIKRLRLDGKSMQDIADILKCSKATIFNYLKRLNKN